MVYFSIGMFVLICLKLCGVWYTHKCNKRIIETRDPNDVKIFNTVIDVLKHKQHLLHQQDYDSYECKKYAFIINNNIYTGSNPTIVPNIQMTSTESAQLGKVLFNFKIDMNIKAMIAEKKKNTELKEHTIEQVKKVHSDDYT